MSSGKKVKSDCGGCRRYPTIKVSDCPIETQCGPGASLRPVYGSLYNVGVEVLAVSDTNVIFDTEGPYSGVKLNTTDNSITVNSQGVYNISFTTVIEVDNTSQVSDGAINFFLSINGTVNLSTIIFSYIDKVAEIQGDTLSRTHQLKLNQGDTIRVFITNVSSRIAYLCPGLVVTKVA